VIDEREERLGERAAVLPPGWAVSALGPVPEDPQERAGWAGRAGRIAGYRELAGWAHGAEPAGPEPSAGPPEWRAAWQAASGAVHRTGGAGLRGRAPQAASPPDREAGS